LQALLDEKNAADKQGELWELEKPQSEAEECRRKEMNDFQ
jgi:hypothetical protein